MPRAQDVSSTAAGAINANVLANTAVQFVERPSRVLVYLTGDAAGEGRAQFKIGSREILAESPMSRQARVPIKPDDLVVDEIAMPGEQLVLRLRNTGAGANNTFWAVEVLPVQ